MEEIEGASLRLGDCVELMRAMPDASVDSIVTDPPYELGFMGKGWDRTGIANSVAMWAEALRVLKPGGHLLAFSGTRTYHRMVCAIEDAGFEVRDQIGWAYGSGFPKSLDVSKAIDKAGGDALAWRAFSAAYASAVESSPMKHADIDRALGIKSSSCYWARTDHRGGMPPRHHWEKVREMLALPDDFARLYDEAEREVVGQDTKARSTSGASELPTMGGETVYQSWDITAPATDAARQWQGWGTALKPAWEPICVARKPLIGTVAENVLAHGTGALNIDGCRVATDDGADRSRPPRTPNTILGGGKGTNSTASEHNDAGRWPANLIHDGSDEVLAAFPGEGDGSAARFFYAAKASRKDRGDGNTHPTVKPTDLMRYLCRLVTPPGGVVLDPFMGSGSTGGAAMLEGFKFIGIDMTPEYVEIARARIAAARA